jgi:hypothetical protein
MFPTEPTPTLARRLLSAARLTRAFLLLEGDDRDVDWEVDAGARVMATHPHRRRLRRRLVERRPGSVPAAAQICVCPVRAGSAGHVALERAPSHASGCGTSRAGRCSACS